MKKKFTISAFVFGILTIICGFVVLYSYGSIDISLALVPFLFFIASVHWVITLSKQDYTQTADKSKKTY